LCFQIFWILCFQIVRILCFQIIRILCFRIVTLCVVIIFWSASFINGWCLRYWKKDCCSI
jgi:hypothetical protein